jgi:hypothetical protein
VALALSGELSPAARQAIIDAYNTDPSFATLDIENIIEVGGILGAFAGEAYGNNNSLSEQLSKEKYISSITHDELAFERYEADGAAMLAFE